MSERVIERTIDPTRQGGNAAPKVVKEAPPPMSVAEALEYDQRFRWRGYPSRDDRARQALADEVRRLRGEAEAGYEAYRGLLDATHNEIERLHAALPILVGCAAGKGLACTLDAHGWHSCCLALRKAREMGLAPPVERRDCEDPA